MEKQANSRLCFLCGIGNPSGLDLRFYTYDKGRCIARFRPRPEHQGHPGHLHGDLISTLLLCSVALQSGEIDERIPVLRIPGH